MKNIIEMNDKGKWINEPEPDWTGFVGWALVTAVVLYSIVEGVLHFIDK